MVAELIPPAVLALNDFCSIGPDRLARLQRRLQAQECLNQSPTSWKQFSIVIHWRYWTILECAIWVSFFKTTPIILLFSAAFAAHLSYDLVAFFRQSTTAFKASPDQFPIILMKLHAQFNWPYPVSSEVIVQESPSNSATISVVDETSSLSSEDVVSSNATSNGFVIMPTMTTSSSTASLSRYAITDFNRKVFEKLCEKSKNRGTRQAEDEIVYIQKQLVKSGALEWILLFSLMRRDVNDLIEALLNDKITLNRLGVFLKCARRGLAKLLEWAEGNW